MAEASGSAGSLSIAFGIEEYCSVFIELADNVPLNQRALLKALYDAPGQRATARQLANELGYQTPQGATLQLGIFARLVRERLGWFHGQNSFVFATFVEPEPTANDDDEWMLVMRPQVAEALRRCGWV